MAYSYRFIVISSLCIETANNPSASWVFSSSVFPITQLPWLPKQFPQISVKVFLLLVFFSIVHAIVTKQNFDPTK